MKNIFYLFFFSCFACQQPPPQYAAKIEERKLLPTRDSLPSQVSFATKMRGATVVAPPKAFSKTEIDSLKAVGVSHIALVPYAFTRLHEPKVHYGAAWQWWGERPEGVSAMVKMAHEAGLKVMLKPQVYVPDGWTGSLYFEKEEDMQQWEKEYENYLMRFVDTAAALRVDFFCIGTEFKQLAIKREFFWRKLIAKIREKYTGKLLYSANWDDFENVPFWDALDLVGTNAYFVLSEKETPSVTELCAAWQPIRERLRTAAKRFQKNIVFSEYGYLSVNGCAGKSWEIEKIVRQLPVNQQAQANAYEALFLTFGGESWWAGGYLWKWFPAGMGHEGYPERDYTPQHKAAQRTLQQFYGQ